MSITTMYGIKNCDTIKKAKKWLEANDIAFEFHDYRAQGLTSQMLVEFESKLGWELLLNRRGTTFRQLTQEQKDGLNKDSALALLLEFPAMIKRPLLIHNDEYHLAFKDAQYTEIFNK
ncbi:transcriptional regulator, Spx/MgsR family [Pseudoalteromonas denitrificans DSM 6059]|uniref:Transcriptional regulator, Spx/MgsR family n=1 Tax=Pseudoalteromonas denitrificans DSM 6059 TaxID=1123010 RepID=A0A1I1MR41_9GAMM|nr:ArsC family reductase [Pseudoalteromonas denitrificans]SFC87829.1 transcriptional regulator, Spx/MgsR family [Pseudoalteromonas denitrificans DSM 6059]